MRTSLGIVLALSFGVSAFGASGCGGCGGGDDDGNQPDASVDAPAGVCGVVAAEIGSYPGMFTGKTVGAGADLTVAEGACADERLYFGEEGDDQVVKLSNLTAGTTYVVDLETTEDLTFYVTSTCTGNMPAAGSCVLHVDETTGNETGEFVAPAGGEVFVIVDSANDPNPPNSGDYTLHVRAAECTAAGQCPSGRPICDNFTCVQCTSSFECNPGAPVCDATQTCVAGPAMCTGDDAGEPDDGQMQATNLTVPTAGSPTIVNHAVCSQPFTEEDWYRVNLTAVTSLRVGMSWTDAAADLDFVIYDSTGEAIDGGIDAGPGPESALESNLAAGTYFIQVYQYSPSDQVAATPYTLTISLPECTTSFNCTDPAKPLCDTGACVAGPTQCTGDDAGDGGTGDDGPAAARDLTGAVGVATSLPGNVCNTPGSEFDWYKVTTTTAGEGIHFALSWTAAANDIDIAVFDATGKLVGLSFWVMPENVDLTFLPVGTYYVRIALADQQTATAVGYTIAATRQTAAACADASSCAATYSNQIYRGNCAAGACSFIAAGARIANMACDSADDCASSRCSYSVFESDAQKSVCTVTCTTTADCAQVAANGFSCTTGFSTNLCLPSCAVATECGVNTQSSALDVGTPWDYFNCTVASGACSP